MFRMLIQKMSAWVETVDILGTDLAEPASELDTHPHRVPVRIERTRRAGAVSARPAVCISPVRSTHDRRPQRATRP
jgi:hypothetical protein